MRRNGVVLGLALVLLSTSGLARAAPAAALQWTSPAPVPAPVDGSPVPPGSVAVSCQSISLCAVVGTYNNFYGYSFAATTTNPASTAPKFSVATTTYPPYDIGPIHPEAVSCPSPSLCVAAADVYAAYNDPAINSEWQANSGGDLNNVWDAVSCASVSLCVLAGTEAESGDIAASTAPSGPSSTWSSVQVGPASTQLVGISCTQSGTCVAVDSTGNAYVSADPAAPSPTWSPVTIDAGQTLVAISCPSTSLCVAVDARGDVITTADPTGGPSAWSAAAVDAGHKLTGVSCASASLCVAVDDRGDALTSSTPLIGGSWTAQDIDGVYALDGVSCSTDGTCMAIDSGHSAATPPTNGDFMVASAFGSAPPPVPGSHITLTPGVHRCSVPCEAAFLATVTLPNGNPEPNVRVQFGVQDAGGADASSHVLYGVDGGSPKQSTGQTDSHGQVLFDVAASANAESYAQLVQGSNGSTAPAVAIVPAVGAVPQALTIAADLVPSAGGTPVASTRASWSLYPTGIRTVLIRPTDPNVSIDTTLEPTQDVAAFVFDPYGNQYRFGLRAYIQTFSSSGRGQIQWRSISRFLEGNEVEDPFATTETCVDNPTLGQQCFDTQNLCSGAQPCQLPNCIGDIVCQAELEVDQAIAGNPSSTADANNLPAFYTSSVSGEQLVDIEHTGDPIQGPWAALFPIQSRRSRSTDTVQVSAAAIDGLGKAHGAFSPNGRQLLIDPVTNVRGPASEWNETDVVFSTGSSSIASPEKTDQGIQLATTATAAVFACAAGVEGAPETLGTSAVLALVLGCGSALDGAAGGVVGIDDPPLGPYTKIALPRSIPNSRVSGRLCTVLRVSSGCQALVSGARQYSRASERVSSLEEAFALSLNRHAGAERAGDFQAALAQQGAARAIAASLNTALRTERGDGRRLAGLLVDVRANPRLSARTVTRTIKDVRHQITHGMRGLPRWLSRRLVNERLAASPAQLRQLLLTALSHVRNRGVTLASLFSQIPIPRSYAGYASRMTSANLTGLVQTLIANRAISGAKHRERVLGDTLNLDGPGGCSAGKRKTLAKRLMADVEHFTRGSLRDLLVQAVTPFVRYRRGISAVLPSCKTLAAGKATVVRRIVP